jgi:hypothetical protein
MRKVVEEWTFTNPGKGNVERVMFYAVTAANGETRREYLMTAYRLGKEF